jgi:hypothetical protein
MRQWQKWWLLFAVIWSVIAAIQVVLILATSEEPDKAVQPLLLGVAVPAALYALLWVVMRLRRKP